MVFVQVDHEYVYTYRWWTMICTRNETTKITTITCVYISLSTNDTRMCHISLVDNDNVYTYCCYLCCFVVLAAAAVMLVDNTFVSGLQSYDNYDCRPETNNVL